MRSRRPGLWPRPMMKLRAKNLRAEALFSLAFCRGLKPRPFKAFKASRGSRRSRFPVKSTAKYQYQQQDQERRTGVSAPHILLWRSRQVWDDRVRRPSWPHVGNGCAGTALTSKVRPCGATTEIFADVDGSYLQNVWLGLQAWRQKSQRQGCEHSCDEAAGGEPCRFADEDHGEQQRDKRCRDHGD